MGRAGPAKGCPCFRGLDDGEDYSRPRLPIHLHRLGLDQQHGTGAPVAERMWVEALLSAANQTPNRPEKYSVTFREFMQALWPGQHLRPSEWLPKVEAAAEALSRREARIAWEDPATGHGGLRQVVAVTDIPRTPDKLEDLVTVTVDLPPGSRAGPLMPKNLLAWGARSHLAFVGLINLGFNWFDPGALRVPAKRGTHWLQVAGPDSLSRPHAGRPARAIHAAPELEAQRRSPAQCPALCPPNHPAVGGCERPTERERSTARHRQTAATASECRAPDSYEAAHKRYEAAHKRYEAAHARKVRPLI